MIAHHFETKKGFYESQILTSMWVRHDSGNWECMYVRVGTKALYTPEIEGKPHKVIVLANIEAKEQGKGTFTSLVKELQETHPEFTIIVESVLSERFAKGLLKRGFLPMNLPDNFYLPTKD